MFEAKIPKPSFDILQLILVKKYINNPISKIQNKAFIKGLFGPLIVVVLLLIYELNFSFFIDMLFK
ncbi:Uncharacterised protein [Chlamydia abortus]|jgi:hypothetical protein|nr:Uncharacterised protein [Chlamydia abortus]SGA31126.1 Uncharacterised protein [Chlamydia abortus]SGA31150.1 Uncharacterised protein [Chlamydia abortus]SGA32185.1 Uncharacterised protein [Chlamydia abortus]